MNTLSTSHAIDTPTCLLLHELMGDEGFQEIVQVFLDDTRESLEHLDTAIRNQQADIVGGICHRLKSSSKLVGALNMANLVTDLEAYSTHKDGTRAHALLRKTATEFTEVAVCLEQQLAALA